jgi:hypothetical protein
MATRRSTRKRPVRRTAVDRPLTSSIPHAPEVSPALRHQDRKISPAAPERDLAELPLLEEILGRFSDALDLVKTAHRALSKAQQDEIPIGPEVTTLERGIDELGFAYNQFDLALLDLGSRGGAP